MTASFVPANNSTADMRGQSAAIGSRRGFIIESLFAIIPHRQRPRIMRLYLEVRISSQFARRDGHNTLSLDVIYHATASLRDTHSRAVKLAQNSAYLVHRDLNGAFP